MKSSRPRIVVLGDMSRSMALRSPTHTRAETRDQNDKKRDDKKESSSSRNFKKRFQKRRDRSGGPRPARPR
jgi:hypothetical protein